MLFECVIATPFERYQENVHMVTLPGAKGILGVLINHAPMMVMLAEGEINLYETASHIVKRFKTKEGYAHITPTFCHVYVKGLEIV